MTKFVSVMVCMVCVIGGYFYNSELERKEEREEKALISQLYELADLGIKEVQGAMDEDLKVALKDYSQRLRKVLVNKVSFEIVEIKDDVVTVKVKSPDFYDLLKNEKDEEKILKRLEKNDFKSRERTIRLPLKMEDDHRVVEKSEDFFRSVYSGLETYFTSSWENIE